VSAGRRILDPRRLTFGDLRRLREALADHPVLKDEDGNSRDVADMLETRDFALVGTLCVLADRLRTDPDFTWEQAEEVELGDVEPDDDEDVAEREPDPPTGPGGSPGPGPATLPARRSRRKPSGAAAKSSSAPSTTSPDPSSS